MSSSCIIKASNMRLISIAGIMCETTACTDHQRSHTHVITLQDASRLPLWPQQGVNTLNLLSDGGLGAVRSFRYVVLYRHRANTLR